MKQFLFLFLRRNQLFVTNLAAALNPTETMNETAEIDILQTKQKTKKN